MVIALNKPFDALDPSGTKNKRSSSRGSHRQSINLRMDLMGTLEIPEAKPERIKDDIYTLFDDDFDPSIKGVKDWILDCHQSLDGYWHRKAKVEELLRKNLGFHDGMRYIVTILLSELTVTQGKELSDRIIEELGPLLATHCADCKKKIEDEDDAGLESSTDTH